MIEIPHGPHIADEELVLRATRGGGPGGQHVNKVSTRIELTFDVDASPSLTPEQRSTVRQKLARRISAEGVLRIVAQDDRSQIANRKAAMARFVELMSRAFAPVKKRRPTRATKASRERRLVGKKRRAEVKQGRGRKPAAEE